MFINLNIFYPSVTDLALVRIQREDNKFGISARPVRAKEEASPTSLGGRIDIETGVQELSTRRRIKEEAKSSTS